MFLGEPMMRYHHPFEPSSSVRLLSRLPHGDGRKSMTWPLFAVALCALVIVLGAFVPTSAFADDLSLSTPPVHHKTLTDNGDGSYDVTLTVKGEEKETETQTAGKADVIIVFDRSNSMRAPQKDTNGNDSTRLDVAKDATNNLIDQLADSGNDVNIAFVQFGTQSEILTSSGFNANATGSDARWYSATSSTDVDSLKVTIGKITTPAESISISGGSLGATNWEDALSDANSVMSAAPTSRADAKKYIIFVSDGNPTVRNTYVDGETREIVYSVEVDHKDYLLTDPDWGGSWLSTHQLTYGDNGDYYVTDKNNESHLLLKHNSDGSIVLYPVDENHNVNTEGVLITKEAWNARDKVSGQPLVYEEWTEDPRTDLKKYGIDGTGVTDAYGYNYNHALTQAKDERASGVTLYAVSTATDASRMDNLAEDANSTEKPAKFYDGTTTENLNDAFSKIAGEITKKSRRYKDVTISDTLSEWAEFSDLGKDANGNVIVTYKKDGVAYTPSTAATISGKTVTWNITDADGDTELDKDVTYSMTFKIWPNQAAFDRAANIQNGIATTNASGEEVVGKDSGTNWNGTAVDSTEGIYSNDFGSKTVYENGSTTSTTTENTYVKWNQFTTTTVNGVEQPSETTGPWYDGYEHPTMEVPTSKITVTKVWEDAIDSSHRPDSIKLTLYKDGEVAKDKSGNDVTLTLTSGMSWTGSFDYAVPAGPTGHTYSVKEDTTDIRVYYDPAYGYKVITSPHYSYEGTTEYPISSASDDNVKLQGRQAQEGGATVTNKVCTMSLTVVKKGATAGSSTDPWNLAGAKFKLSKATIGTDGKITVGDQVGDELASGNDGSISFGPVLTANSDYFLEETDAPEGYLTAGPYVIRVKWVESEQDYVPVLYKATKQSDGTYALGDEIGVLDKIENDRMQRTMTVTDYTIPPLPHSGGPGNVPLILSGVLLLGLSLDMARHQLASGRGG